METGMLRRQLKSCLAGVMLRFETFWKKGADLELKVLSEPQLPCLSCLLPSRHCWVHVLFNSPRSNFNQNRCFLTQVHFNIQTLFVPRNLMTKLPFKCCRYRDIKCVGPFVCSCWDKYVSFSWFINIAAGKEPKKDEIFFQGQIMERAEVKAAIRQKRQESKRQISVQLSAAEHVLKSKLKGQVIKL